MLGGIFDVNQHGANNDPEKTGPPPGFEPRSLDWETHTFSTTPRGSRVPQNKFFVTTYSLCGLRNEIDWGMARHEHIPRVGFRGN
jgi:hypothetical protein